MASPDHTHDLEALDGRIGRFHGLKAAGGTNDSLEATVIGLNDVVQVLRRSMLFFVTACLRAADGGSP